MIAMIGSDGGPLLLIFFIVSLVYLYYFWIAKEEIKGKPKIKRIVWLVIIPILPVFFFIFPFYALVVLIISIVFSEASECQQRPSEVEPLSRERAIEIPPIPALIITMAIMMFFLILIFL